MGRLKADFGAWQQRDLKHERYVRVYLDAMRPVQVVRRAVEAPVLPVLGLLEEPPELPRGNFHKDKGRDLVASR